MTSTRFQFTMTIPCDPRLTETVRDLAMHAARFAQLTEAVGTEVAAQVQAAAATTIDAAGGSQHTLELHIARDGGALDVRLNCEMPAHTGLPVRLSPSPGLTVEWSSDGSQRSCVISQQTR